jgi:uncharacterized membrane protein
VPENPAAHTSKEDALSFRPVAQPAHPALQQHVEERRSRLQNRIADEITRFAGSMPFIYIHVVWFTAWIALRVEKFPFGLLTMMVSLEAIFLSTFVMISQNRADEKREVLADHQWMLVQEEGAQNEELLSLSRQILQLTTEIHQLTKGSAAAEPGPGSGSIGEKR